MLQANNIFKKEEFTKKTVILAAALSLALMGSAFAVDNGQSQKGPGPNFDQKKASIIKKLDERVKKTKEAQNCVQAAKTMDDLKVCRENRMEHLKEIENIK